MRLRTTFLSMMSGPVLLLATLAMTSVYSTPAAAAYLTPTDAIREVMDGKPWSARTADGHDASITLSGDGSGAFSGGPLSFPISWVINGRDICLHVGPAGEKCVRFKKIDKGFEGWAGDRLDLTLRR